MATKKEAVAVGSPMPQGARAATATGDVRLTEMPPAETFVGLVAYGVDTTTDESKQIPLEFLASGVQACIDATQASTEQTELAKTATSNADTATTGANDAAETARGEAENLSALKEAVVNATTDAVAKTAAAKTATGAANTATTNANNATADAIAKTEAAQTATEETIAAKDAAIEATENLTGDVSALVLTDANKPRIQELAGIDYSILTEQIVPGEFWRGAAGTRKQVYTRTLAGTLTITEGYHRVSLIPGAGPVPIDFFGYVSVGHWDDPVSVPNKLIHAMRWGLYGVSLEFDPSLLGKSYYVTVKYIKL